MSRLGQSRPFRRECMSGDAGSRIRYAEMEDSAFWFKLDRHLPLDGFESIVRDRRGYIIMDGMQPVGLLRYGLFWDLIPFCHLIYITGNCQGRGLGRKLMTCWENDMQQKGYGIVLTSTQVDEQAQHFYRRLGYRDCGGLLLDFSGYGQPMELFMAKPLTPCATESV